MFRKWDGSLHWHYTAVPIGSDEHGTWLGAGRGTPIRRGDEEPVASPAFVVLVPEDAWWVAVWNDLTPPTPFPWEVYVDVCTPAIWGADSVEAVDLDLDVTRTLDGTCAIRDEGEFEAHAAALGYPEDVRAAAPRAAATVLGLLSTGSEPFGEAGMGRLRRLMAGE